MLLLSTRRARTATTLCLVSIFAASIAFSSPFVRSKFARTAVTSSLRYSAPKELRVDDGVITPVAGSITVNSTADVVNSTDGLCTLREAIIAARTDTPSGTAPGECVAGSGADTINFSVTGVINLATELPVFNGHDFSLAGPGASQLTIQPNTAPSAPPDFPIFHKINGTVAISGVTLRTSGIVNQGGNLTITDSVIKDFIGNGEQPQPGGGAIINYSTGTATMINTTFTNDGNGLYNDFDSTSTVSSCTLTSSGISNQGTLNIDRSTLNSSVGISNVHFQSHANIINITNSTLNNSGIGNSLGTIDITNSTLSASSISNSSDSNHGSLNITNATIDGGGISNSKQSNGVVQLRNTIVASSSVTRGFVNGNFVSQGHNLIVIGDGSTGFTNGVNGDQVGTSATPLDPRLGLLANNGGPTQTVGLLSGSPAIDAGDNCVTQATHCGDPNIPQITFDQRGPAFNRAVDGNNDGAATVDIGAIEFYSSSNGKLNQAIAFGPLANKTLGDPPFNIFANASSGLPVTLSVLSGPATISGNTVTITGLGTVVIRASQAGDSNYNPAPNVDQSFTVTRATSTSITSSLNPANFGQSVTFTATVTSSSGTPTGTVQFKIDNANLGMPVSLNASGVAQITTSSMSAGAHMVIVNYAGDSDFSPSSGALAQPQMVQTAISINDLSLTEGDAGTKIMNFTVTLSTASNLTVKVDYATANGTATAPSDYAAIPTTTLTFNPGELSKTIGVTINGDQMFEPDETFFVNLSNPVNATISKAQSTGTIVNDEGGIIRFSLFNYNVSESTGFVTITVNRSGNISFPATVDYATDDTGAPAACSTSNGKASSRCDYTTAAGTLSFAAGDNAKTFQVLLSQDGYAEQPEAFTLNLSNLTGGAVLGAPSTATVTIANAAVGSANPIDDAQNFVRQHYHDFLNREPDASGLAFWTNQITSCGSDQACIELRRINVSAAFFLSIEFQQTGYLVERLYKASYGDTFGMSTLGGAHQLPVPIIRLNEFLPDTQQIGQGVVVGQTGWEDVLESNKQAFTLGFVQRTRFTSAYPTSMTPGQFVDKLSDNAGVPKSGPEYNAAINEFGAATTTSNTAARARALRRVAENSTFTQQEFNRAFVLMQYFGYLRRNPNDPQDTDYTGYDFWLTKLNQFSGNFVNAEMVKGFITSGEYRNRFGP
jgi:CSLREA domain-containing protein